MASKELLFCNWQPAPSSEELSELLKKGKAVKTDRYFVIRQVHVYSLKEYLDTVTHFRSLIGEHVLLFRGQNKDYFEKDRLVVLPPAYRNERLMAMYVPFLRASDKALLSSELAAFRKYPDMYDELIKALSPWEEVLSIFNLDYKSGVTLMYREKDDTIPMVRFAQDRTASTRVVSNPNLMALLQHYGFPTPCLDVTSDPIVALWFALHSPNVNDKGEIFYTRFKDVTLDNNIKINYTVPSVYIYIVFSHVYDLTKIENIRGIAGRPFIQSGFSLPFRQIIPTYYQSPGTPKLANVPTKREPSAVLKIHFHAKELLKLHSNLTTAYLFPKREPLYKKLVEKNVPNLVRYE